MASFTDIQPLKFNKYVQQQPIEAMAQVGMAKQKAHEEGIQKIQTQIDNIAGLEVARDIDKAYLQSKLNELGNNLRTVAAGDFSDMQVVSTASGMTKQLIHDKGIQNAVSSAARLKKEQAFMEKEREKGELHPANEYVFNKQVGAWYDNKDINAKFNAKYDKYFDVDKFIKDAFAGLKEDGLTIDQIYKTDSNNNPIINPRTGQFELSNHMVRLKKEGLFPPKVQQTLDYIFSDPRVNKQLSINGQYTYRNTDNAGLAVRLNSAKDTQVNVLDKNIMDLTIKKSLISDEFEKARLDKQIEDAVSAKNETIQNYNDIVTNLDTQSDAAKAMLYKMDTKAKFKDIYSHTVEERTIHDNPAAKYEFDVQKEANAQRRHEDQMRYNYANMAQDKELAIMKMDNDLRVAKAKEEAEKAAAAGTYTVGAIDDERAVTSAFYEEGKNAWNTFAKTTDEVLLTGGLIKQETLTAYMAKVPGLSREEALHRLVNAEAKKAGQTPTEFRSTMYPKIKEEMTKKNRFLNRDARIMRDNADIAEKNLNDYLGRRNKMLKDYPMPASASPKDLTPITVKMHTGWTDWSGTDVVLSVEDQMNLAVVLNEDNDWFSSDEDVKESDKARAKLNKRGINDHMIAVFNDQYTSEGNPLAGVGPKAHTKNLLKYMGKTDTPEVKAVMKQRADYIKKTSTYNPSVSRTLGTSKADLEAREQVAGMIGYYANERQNESPDFMGNVDKMAKIAEKEDNGTIRFEATKDKQGNITNKALFFDDKGAYAGSMVIDATEANAAKFYPETMYASPLKQYCENKMALTQNGTTARTDVSSVDTYRRRDAGLIKSDFKNLNTPSNSKLDIMGNIKETTMVGPNGQESKVYLSYIYIDSDASDSGPGFVVPIGSPQNSLEDAVSGLSNITPQMVNLAISQRKSQNRR